MQLAMLLVAPNPQCNVPIVDATAMATPACPLACPSLAVFWLLRRVRSGLGVG